MTPDKIWPTNHTLGKTSLQCLRNAVNMWLNGMWWHCEWPFNQHHCNFSFYKYPTGNTSFHVLLWYYSLFIKLNAKHVCVWMYAWACICFIHTTPPTIWLTLTQHKLVNLGPSSLSNSLLCQHPIWLLVQVVVVPVPLQLLDNLPGKAWQNGPSTWAFVPT